MQDPSTSKLTLHSVSLYLGIKILQTISSEKMKCPSCARGEVSVDIALDLQLYLEKRKGELTEDGFDDILQC